MATFCNLFMERLSYRLTKTPLKLPGADRAVTYPLTPRLRMRERYREGQTDRQLYHAQLLIHSFIHSFIH